MDDEQSLDSEGIPDLEGPLPEKVATGDPQEGVSPPADHPASLRFGVTGEEQREGESLDSKLAREEPDIVDGDSASIVLVAPEDEDLGVPDDEKDEVARAAEPGGGASAEESAIHIVEPPGRTAY